MKSYDTNTIKEICHKYAYDRCCTQKSISKALIKKGKKITVQEVSECLHLGIKRNIVDDKTARLIEKKAIENSSRHNVSSLKIVSFYNRLFKEREQLKKQSEAVTLKNTTDKTTGKLHPCEDINTLYKEFFLSTFESVYGDSDEFPLSGENLEEEFENYINS